MKILKEKGLWYLAFIIVLVLAMAMFTGCSNGDSDSGSENAGDVMQERIKEEMLKEKAEAVADAMLRGDFEEVCKGFDKTMASVLDAEALKHAWEDTVATLGEYIGRYEVYGDQEGKYFVVKVIENYENSGLIVNVVFDREERIAGLQLTYTDLKGVEAVENEVLKEEVVTVTADPDMPLEGFLTLPKGVEKPPVVVLVHGSGSSNRDENIYGNKPFADIAHGLAEHGIATLRYDKRFFAYPEKAQALGANLTLREEVLDDVNAAIELLKTDSRVDGSKIVVLGHSLGGMMIPAIAAENQNLAGVISMAGSLRSLAEIVYDQNMEVIAAIDQNAMGSDEKAVAEAQIAQLEADMEVLRGDISGLENETLLLGVNAGYWKSLDEYAGMNFIEELTMPILVMQGDADFQVYADKDYPLWEETLAGHENAEFRLYGGLNHLMMPTQGKRDVSEYNVKGTVDEKVIDDIAAFVGGL